MRLKAKGGPASTTTTVFSQLTLTTIALSAQIPLELSALERE